MQCRVEDGRGRRSRSRGRARRWRWQWRACRRLLPLARWRDPRHWPAAAACRECAAREVWLRPRLRHGGWRVWGGSWGGLVIGEGECAAWAGEEGHGAARGVVDVYAGCWWGRVLII